MIWGQKGLWEKFTSQEVLSLALSFFIYVTLQLACIHSPGENFFFFFYCPLLSTSFFLFPLS